MIVKVTAKLNDHEIFLEQVEKNKWNVTVPRVKEGRYYIDLYALDDAGNSAFLATALFAVDANCCVSKFEILDSQLVLKNDKYKVSFLIDSDALEVMACTCMR